MFRLEGDEVAGWLVLSGELRLPLAKIERASDGCWKLKFDVPFVFDHAALHELAVKIRWLNNKYPRPFEPEQHIGRPAEDDDIPF